MRIRSQGSLYIYEMLWVDLTIKFNFWEKTRRKFYKGNQRDYFFAHIAPPFTSKEDNKFSGKFEKKTIALAWKGEHVKLRKTFQMKFLCMLFSALKFLASFVVKKIWEGNDERSFVCTRREHFHEIIPWIFPTFFHSKLFLQSFSFKIIRADFLCWLRREHKIYLLYSLEHEPSH